MGKTVNKKKIALMLTLLLIFSIVFSACIASDAQTNPTLSPSLFTDPTSYSSEVEEPAVSTRGQYTLGQCKENKGIYIAYDDGSFDRYPAGGYCYGFSTVHSWIYGMYLPNNTVDRIPVIDEDDTLVVFSDSDYYLYLYPVNWEVGAIQFTSDDGAQGYAHIQQQNEDIVSVSAVDRVHGHDSWSVLYIDGIPAPEYELEITLQEFAPSRYAPSDLDAVFTYSLPRNSSVVFGIAEGSTLVETTYQVSATYYECFPSHRDCKFEDRYHPDLLPTSEGYAIVNLNERDSEDIIPNGHYVMVLEFAEEGNRGYIATLLDWNNQ